MCIHLSVCACMYIFLCVTYTVMQREINLFEKTQEVYMGRFVGGKRKGKSCNYIILLKNKGNNFKNNVSNWANNTFDF